LLATFYVFKEELKNDRNSRSCELGMNTHLRR
jgi:hypothetical protein